MTSLIYWMYKHRTVSSAALTLVLLILCYLWENVPLSYGQSFDKLYFAERYIQRHFGHNEVVDDGLFINVGYDKAVADMDLYGMNGLFTGKVGITDRRTLDNFLSRLEEDGTYRYIFLDVRFEKGIETPYDSSLFSRIARMRDIVVATHRGVELASPLLEPKAYISDYKTTVTSTGFTRYQFIQRGRTSVPLKIYEDLTGSGIKQVWRLPLYWSGKSLCHNSVFVRIPEDFSENLVDVHTDGGKDSATGIHRQRYFDCGPQIDEDFPLAEEAEGKIVVIGDFVEDVTGTYMGEQANPYLAYLAAKDLIRERHKVSIPYACVLAILFFLTFMAVLSKEGKSVIFKGVDKMSGLLKRKGKSDRRGSGHSILGTFLWNLFEFSISTFLICVVLFLLFGATFSIFIPSLVFSLMAAVTQTWEHPDKKKENDETVHNA